MSEPLHPVLHARWGLVHPMRTEKQPTHVWQHLYNPEERWDGLVRTEIHALRAEAEKLGCPRQPGKLPRNQARPRLPHVSKRCYRLLRAHHDAYYAPAYLRELRQAGTQWALQVRAPEDLLCCTPGGVLVAVGLRAPAVVLTAYRPDVTVDDGSEIDDETFSRTAQERWEGLTMRDNTAWKTGVLRDLEQSSQQPPQRAVDAWRLARAIGLARALGPTEPDFAASLSSAEAMLARHRLELTRLLEGHLRTEQLLTGLSSALEAAEPDEMQDRLIALSDILVVAEVLNLTSEIERIHSRLRQLLISWPPGLAGFERLARVRLGTAGPTARPLWEAVLAAQPSEPPRERFARILETLSLRQFLPPAAHASSGIDLGPEPRELHRWGEALLVLTTMEDLRTLVLQVSGLSSGEVPQGTHDGAPLMFRRDEFDTWLAEARPGAYRITVRDETVEFTLSST